MWSRSEFNANFDGVFGQPECWKCEIPTQDEDRPQHAILLDNFADAVLHGKELLAPGLEGINEMTLANAIYYSDWLGNKWVDVKALTTMASITRYRTKLQSQRS